MSQWKQEKLHVMIMPQMTTEKRADQTRVIFFDGVCHLCNFFVDWVIVRDSNKRFAFAPLQGETARKSLSVSIRESLESVVLLDGENLLRKSDAALAILGELPGWKWTRIFQLVPRFLRDLIYDLIAKNRYRLFGQREVCRIPTKEERGVLLP